MVLIKKTFHFVDKKFWKTFSQQWEIGLLVLVFKKFYPQIFLKSCKYEIKEETIIKDLTDFYSEIKNETIFPYL